MWARGVTARGQCPYGSDRRFIELMIFDLMRKQTLLIYNITPNTHTHLEQEIVISIS